MTAKAKGICQLPAGPGPTEPLDELTPEQRLTRFRHALARIWIELNQDFRGYMQRHRVSASQK